MSNTDVSAELGGLIANSKTFSNSENIRVGKYLFLIKRVFAEKVESGRFAFAELRVLEATKYPQMLPSDVPANKFDTGENPNPVGSDCAMKVNFDGKGAKSAPGNVKAFVLGLFGMNQNETSIEDVNSTWLDLSRQKDQNIGDLTGIDQATNTPIKATKFKAANPAAGLIIRCTATMKEKKATKALPGPQKEFITALSWECVARPGSGENSKELQAQRKLTIEVADDEDDGDDTVVSPTPASAFAPAVASPVPAAPAPAPVPAPAPAPVPPFSPPPGWQPHPEAQYRGPTPETNWFWDGGQRTMSEAQFRATK